MIELHAPDGRKMYLARAAVAQVTEAGTSSQWHGIRSVVRALDGRAIEVRETVEEIIVAMRADA